MKFKDVRIFDSFRFIDELGNYQTGFKISENHFVCLTFTGNDFCRRHFDDDKEVMSMEDGHYRFSELRIGQTFKFSKNDNRDIYVKIGPTNYSSIIFGNEGMVNNTSLLTVYKCYVKEIE